MAPPTQHQPPFGVIAKIAVLWILSDIGYFFLLSLIGDTGGYSADPFVLSGYYLVWIGIALATFWSLFKRWRMIALDATMVGTLVLIGLLVCGYLVYVFPLFPAIEWQQALKPPPEIFSATTWYFLPKSVEIVLQQLLIVAMVLAFHKRQFSLRDISDWSAALFGGAHLLLVFGRSFSYVLVFTMAATVAGFIFPYLVLRVRNGFIYAYALHWTFYAVIITLIRVLYVH